MSGAINGRKIFKDIPVAANPFSGVEVVTAAVAGQLKAEAGVAAVEVDVGRFCGLGEPLAVTIEGRRLDSENFSAAVGDVLDLVV